MKKMLPILLIGILILSGLGAGALNNDKEELDIFSIEYEKSSNNMILSDYTHTVLVEVGTSPTCSACPASNTAWHNIYGSGNYNFEYTEMVVNQNTVANSYMSSRSLYWVPTSYFDGGEYVYPGTNYGTFYNYLDSSGSRPVPDLVATLEAEWLGNAEISISLSIDNNDGSAYPGRMRIYIIELESTLWNDALGNPYYHAFLGFAFNKAINIPAGGTYADSTIWNGAAAGYPGITRENTQVILAIFDETPHQSYSDPPSSAPFLAYYVDETIAVIPEIQNSSPYVPSNPYPENGSTNVDADTILSWTGGDPNPGDTVTYNVYSDTFSPPTTLVSVDQTGTTYDPGILEYNTQYYWQIVADDGVAKETTPGPIWSFTTENKPTIVSIDPPSQIVGQGETFTVSVWVYPSEPINGVSFNFLYFNATLIHANSVTFDDFFDPLPTIRSSSIPGMLQINNTLGEIRNVFEGVVGPGNVTADGSFVTIEFTAQTTLGSSNLDLDVVEITDPDVNVLPTVINNGNVTVIESDITPPEITEVTVTHSDPKDTDSDYGWENFTCTVTDNNGIDTVKLVLIGNTTTEYPMFKDGDDYYCNITISAAGRYIYHIWANDTKGKENISSPQLFDMPLNEDVNEDGSVGFVDIMSIAGMWGATGPNGWIRADVNNDGSVGFVDIMSVAGMWGQEW